MTDFEGLLTPAQLKAMGPSEMADFLHRSSGDPNFQWWVREAVLNRAAELLRRAIEPHAPQAEAGWSTLAAKYSPFTFSRLEYTPLTSRFEHVPEGDPEEAGYIYARIVLRDGHGKTHEYRMRRVDRDAENRTAEPK